MLTQQDMISDSLTVGETAETLHVTVRTVGRWIKDGDITAYPNPADGRSKLIPRSEVERLTKAQLSLEHRMRAAGGAAGFLDAHWRIGYRKAFREIADAGAALARHLREIKLEQPDAEHEPDHCERCRDMLDQLLRASEQARGYAYLAPITADLYRVVREAAQAADNAREELRADD